MNTGAPPVWYVSFALINAGEHWSTSVGPVTYDSTNFSQHQPVEIINCQNDQMFNSRQLFLACSETKQLHNLFSLTYNHNTTSKISTARQTQHHAHDCSTKFEDGPTDRKTISTNTYLIISYGRNTMTCWDTIICNPTIF